MAKQTLPTNFKDDILSSSMGGKRRYNLIQNSDGTYSFEDVTEYTQTGSDFGAGQMNAINQAVNESCDKANVIDDLDDVVANQASGMIAGALAVSKLISNLYEDLTEYFTVNWAWDVDRLEAARTGRLVHISFMCHPKDSWSANQIYTVLTSTLPDEYKPEYRTYSSGVKMNGDGTDVNNCAFIVQPTGDINIAVGAKVTSGYFLCNMTYVCVGSS